MCVLYSLSQSPYFIYSFESATGSFCLHRSINSSCEGHRISKAIFSLTFLSLALAFDTDSDSCLFKYLPWVRGTFSPFSSYFTRHSWGSLAVYTSSKSHILNSGVPQSPVVGNCSSLFTFTGISVLMTLKYLSPDWPIESSQPSAWQEKPFYNLASAWLSNIISCFSPGSPPRPYFFLKKQSWVSPQDLSFEICTTWNTLALFLPWLTAILHSRFAQMSPPWPPHLKW